MTTSSSGYVGSPAHVIGNKLFTSETLYTIAKLKPPALMLVVLIVDNYKNLINILIIFYPLSVMVFTIKEGGGNNLI